MYSFASGCRKSQPYESSDWGQSVESHDICKMASEEGSMKNMFIAEVMWGFVTGASLSGSYWNPISVEHFLKYSSAIAQVHGVVVA